MKKITLFILIAFVLSGCGKKYTIDNLSKKNNNTATIKFDDDTNFPWVPGKPVTHYYIPNTPLKCDGVAEHYRKLNYEKQIIRAGKYFSIFNSYMGPYFLSEFPYQCSSIIKFLPKKGASYVLKISHQEIHCKTTLLRDLGKGRLVNVPFTEVPLCIEK